MIVVEERVQAYFRMDGVQALLVEVLEKPSEENPLPENVPLEYKVYVPYYDHLAKCFDKVEAANCYMQEITGTNRKLQWTYYPEGEKPLLLDFIKNEVPF